MFGIKTSNTKKTFKLSLNQAFILAFCTLVLCWLYGLPALAGSIVVLRRFFELRKKKQPAKGPVAFKMKWGYFMAWAGFGFSLAFSVFYVVALISGGLIRPW